MIKQCARIMPRQVVQRMVAAAEEGSTESVKYVKEFAKKYHKLEL